MYYALLHSARVPEKSTDESIIPAAKRAKLEVNQESSSLLRRTASEGVFSTAPSMEMLTELREPGGQKI